jgi:hypothetical protein
MDKSVAGRWPPPQQVIEDDIHRIIADVLAGVSRKPARRAQIRSEIAKKLAGAAFFDRAQPVILAVAPPVKRDCFDAQARAAAALPQAQDQLRFVLVDGGNELGTLEFYRKNDFGETGARANRAQEVFRNVGEETAVRAEAVEQDAHGRINAQPG